MSTEIIHSADGASNDEGGSRLRRVHKPDLIITSVLLVVFVVAFLMATGWKDLAAYFPLGVSGAGVIASASLLVRVLFFPPKPDAPKTDVPDAAKSVAEQEYEFSRTSRRGTGSPRSTGSAASSSRWWSSGSTLPWSPSPWVTCAFKPQSHGGSPGSTRSCSAEPSTASSSSPSSYRCPAGCSASAEHPRPAPPALPSRVTRPDRP